MNIRVFHKTELAPQSQRVVWGDVADKLISRRYRRTAGRPGKLRCTRPPSHAHVVKESCCTENKIKYLCLQPLPRGLKSQCVDCKHVEEIGVCGGCLLKQKLAFGERGKFATVADSPGGGFGSPHRQFQVCVCSCFRSATM